MAGGLQPIKMNEEEVMNIFIAAIMMIGCQICMMGMIIYYERTSPNFEIRPANSFTIILARLLSSIMMHLNVEPEIRAGLVLSKYCLNHPNKFKGAYEMGPGGEEIINYSRILPPLFLSMAQVCVGLVVEINILVYLTSIKSLLGVIMQFVTLAAICKFDDMYAANLFDNKMLDVAGKKLKKCYFRHHEFLRVQYLRDKHGTDNPFEEGFDGAREIPNYNPESKEIYDPLGYNTPAGEYMGK